MKKINVIDLDKTLINYDSFRFLIKNEIKRLNIKILFKTILRVLKVHDATLFKKNISKILEQKEHRCFDEFALHLYKTINQDVFKLIQDETDDNTINILVSASPNVYVLPLIKMLQWQGSGSYFDTKGVFIHLFEENKINWLKENFNQSDYIYNFAISDSSTDDKLLEMFIKKKKWILQ